MKTKQNHKKLFQELKQWSRFQNAFSVKDFLKEKNICIYDFERIASSSEKFMKIWEAAESQAWKNLTDALFKKSLPRSRIAEYIKQSTDFQGDDPEEIMRNLESGQAKLELYLTAIGDTESLRKYGRLPKMNEMEALMKYSLERRLITEEQYANYIQIEKNFKENKDEDC